MSLRIHTKSLFAAAALALTQVAFSEQPSASGLDSFFHQGKAGITLRYRFENVDQAGIVDDANASTLLSRLTWTSGELSGFSAQAEVDNISYIGSDLFNNTENGKTGYPVVADPDYTEVNQAYLIYKGAKGQLMLGRQRINHGSQRFLGGVAWRQNEQTFDAFRAKAPLGGLTLDYSYVWNVNRIFGPEGSDADLKGGVHALRADYKVPSGTLSGFAYSLDFDTAAALSSTTYGIEYQGDYKLTESIALNVNLTAAQQNDTGDNTANYRAPYYLAEITGKFKPFSVDIGYEALASDNGVGFNTPLATLHKFQGFADQFLATPAAGVEDHYVNISGKIAGITLVGAWHDFTSETGGVDYGSEMDLSAAYSINKNVSLLLKYATYDADSFKTDTDKLWLMVTMKF